jgi:hypothetical protein
MAHHRGGRPTAVPVSRRLADAAGTPLAAWQPARVLGMNQVEGVDEVAGCATSTRQLNAAGWGDPRLDQTAWLPMKGLKTPERSRWRSRRVGSPSWAS